ncbi:LOW QUALITY PROTEIN: nose resistant to fluoxetine protein 6-like [Paramacrobiotus metropolitanus]|uniref:LOW QUALITY PROTEIN: nose resistant to fluoxetine protein 6-like n=1 Tax=Paramacrobiotus metropolitanus TaxID=2943436 RepID=UPI0024465A0B|nr:LOW QUALITY PROTEIN: nose resistant to fluoxetine protein 6-like [Paramacrobiotus metropolitanus]
MEYLRAIILVTTLILSVLCPIYGQSPSAPRRLSGGLSVEQMIRGGAFGMSNVEYFADEIGYLFEEQYLTGQPGAEGMFHPLASLQRLLVEGRWPFPGENGATQATTPASTPAPQVSSACALDMASLLLGLRQNSTFALQVADAAAKPASDILHGALTWPGSFSECIALNSLPETKRLFQTHYCLVAVGQTIQPLPSGFVMISASPHIGLCMPHSCSDRDTDILFIMALNQLNVSLGSRKLLANLANEYVYDTKAIAWIAVCCCFLFAMITGTVLDVAVVRYVPPAPRTDDDELLVDTGMEKDAAVQRSTFRVDEAHIVVRILLAFSLYTNGMNLLSTKSVRAPGIQDLACLHGIRFLTMGWVILAHTHVFAIPVYSNILDGLTVLSDFWDHTVSNAFVAVDTFFTISGFLVTYITLKKLMARPRTHWSFWPVFYVHRFWRLTPPYMLLLGLYVSLYAYTGAGPWWPFSGPEVDACRNTWYANFFYINNVYKDQEMCMNWTWYMANDMQFYIISPIFLYLFSKNKKLGIVAVLAALGAHIAVTAVISHHYALPISQFGSNLSDPMSQQNALNYSVYYYFKPWTRIGPYLIGILLGFLIVSKPELKLKSVYTTLLWIFSIGIFVSIVYGTYPNDNGAPFSNNLASAYNALHRTAWAVGLSWLIAACIYGYGGPVNVFLSFRGFIPLSRLTYCAYLIHPMVIFHQYYIMTSPLRYDKYTMTYYFFGHVCITMGLAAVVSLAFEVPMMQLEKLLFRKLKLS